MRRTIVTCDECGAENAGPYFALSLTRSGSDGLYDTGYSAIRELCEDCGERVIAALGLPENNRGFLRSRSTHTEREDR